MVGRWNILLTEETYFQGRTVSFRECKYYCWWQKSCTTCYTRNPMKHGIFFHQEYAASFGALCKEKTWALHLVALPARSMYDWLVWPGKCAQIQRVRRVRCTDLPICGMGTEYEKHLKNKYSKKCPKQKETYSTISTHHQAFLLLDPLCG